MTSTFDPSSTRRNPTRGNSTRGNSTIESVYRAEWGRLLAQLVSRTRRLDLVEDALSEAFEQASQRWPVEGTPPNPGGWLYTAAYRRVVGVLRAEVIARRKAPHLTVRSDWESSAFSTSPISTSTLGDERLQLILLCCHPALPQESRAALALRLVIGTPTEQIARLFLVSTSTMAARLTRAKKKIVLAGIPLSAPIGAELADRLDEVCRTIYLAFTAGYAPGASEDLVRNDLAGEAVELASVLHELVPEVALVTATLALLMLQHARRDARVVDGDLTTLAAQNRALWRHDEIQTGLNLVNGLQPNQGYVEELRLQALIAAEHMTATAENTNWVNIARHYANLETLTGSPVVRLNRSVAEAEANGPSAGLALLVGLDVALPGNHRVAAVRAELARRNGNLEIARLSFRLAIAQCANGVERAHLAKQLAEISTFPSPAGPSEE